MIRQTMFSTGEVDEINWKRTDVDSYLSAAQSLHNLEVGTTGLAKKRKGMSLQMVLTAYAENNSRIYEFVDNNQNYYMVISVNLAFHVFKVADNDFTFYQTVVTPYVTANLPTIDYTQDNDSIIFAHGSYAPARIYISSYSDPVNPTFAYAALDIYPYPSYDFGKINYNNFTVALSEASGILTFEFTGVGANPGYNNDWVGGQIIGGGASDVDPIGYANILTVSYAAGGGGVVTFTARIQVAFETGSPSVVGSQYSIRQPMWSATLGYPSKVLYYQNRLWLAGNKSLNNTIAGSQINAPIDFDVGTGRDTDAIVYTIGQTNSGRITWLNGGKQLEIYTDNYEFVCPQDTNTALTPSTFAIRQQSSYGSSNLFKPMTYINDSYYTIRSGNAFVNFHFDGVGLAYVSTNISAASLHLIKNPTNRALLRGTDTSQDNFIYLLNQSDNTLTSFQFATEYKLAAFTPIAFQDDVNLIDITSINNQIYILKKYTLTSTFTVERMEETVKIDSQRNATMADTGVVTGLSQLNGYTVQVVYQNQDFGQYEVVAGSITVDNPNEIAGTVQIGLLYDVELVPMYFYSGATDSPLMKSVNRIYIDYYQSLNWFINGKLVPYQKFSEIQAGLPLTPQTGTEIFAPISGWNRFDSLAITQSSPFDLQILSIAYQIDSSVI